MDGEQVCLARLSGLVLSLWFDCDQGPSISLEAVADLGVQAVAENPFIPDAGIIVTAECVDPAELQLKASAAITPHQASGSDGVVKAVSLALDASHAD